MSSRPAADPPRLRKRKASIREHKRGHFIVRDRGKDIYLGLDYDKAKAKAIELVGLDRLDLSTRPRRSKSSPEAIQRWAGRVSRQMAKQTKPLIALSPWTFQKAATSMLTAMEAELTKEGLTHYRKCLEPFLAMFGATRVYGFKPDRLQAYRTALIQTYKPKTVNHRLNACRRLLKYCWEMEYVEIPFRDGILKPVPLPPTPDKGWSADEVRSHLSAIATVNPNLAKMLLLQFWTCMRPGELPRVIWKHGQFEKEWPYVYRLARGKTDLQTGEPTRIIFTDRALKLLKRIEPLYRSDRAYDKAVNTAVSSTGIEFTAGRLRHSAAKILIGMNVETDLVEACLHHTPPRVQRTYRPPPFERARKALEKLAKAVPDRGLI